MQNPENIKARSQEQARLRVYVLNIFYDLLAMLVAFTAANLLVLGSVMGEPGKPHGLIMFLMIAPVYTLIAIQGGAYGLRLLASGKSGVPQALWSLVQAAMLTFLIAYLGKISEQLSRLTFFAGFLLSAVGLWGVRRIMPGIAEHMLQGLPQITVLIRDGVEFAGGAHMHCVDAQEAGIDPTRLDADMAARLALCAGGERVVVACTHERMDDWANALKALGARCEILIPDMDHFAPASFGEFERRPTVVVTAGPMAFRDRIIKRLFDLIIGSIAVVLLSPLLIASAIAVRLSGPGPILFRQQRIGRDAHPFAIYKFRTMRHADCDAKAAKLTERDDPRVTRIGAFLRKTSLDELPQLFNVLKGDMSIVGPRPHAAAAKAADQLYWELDPRYWERHCIKPGMTGLAQVRGFRGATVEREDLLNRLQADLEYVTNWSIWRDIAIMASTLRVLVHDRAF